jgi:hypothetical protein
MAVALPLLVTVLSLLALTAPALAQSFTDVTTAPLNDAGNGYGMAWGDYDNDGHLDLYLVNSGSANKLFRNNGNGTFTDVTAAPLNSNAGGRSAVWGDYDNDGDLDLYLVNFGSANKLFRNNGDGTFTDVTTGALADNGNGAAAAWADYDNDGYVDLYISKENQPNKLLHNNGDGTFTDVTPATLADAGQSEGVAWGDYDNDGDLDLYVANLGTANKLFRNDGGGNFTDVSASAGVNDAFNGTGVAWGDYDNDGDLDLFLVNAQTGTDKLFRNNGDGTFTDVSNLLPVDSGNGRSVAWGDYDNDGDLDLYITNFGQANKLFRNDNGTFVDATAGTPLGDTGNSRGAAWGDFDGDGDLDLYLVNSGAANKLFRNDQPAGNHWLEVKLVGTISNKSAIGARVTVVAGGVSRMQEVSGGSGFLSQNSLPIEFGLGASNTIDSLIVNWPSGVRQAARPVPAVNAIVTVTEPSSFSLAAGVVGNGTVTKVPNQSTYAYRSTVQLTATPGTGYHFVGWSLDASGTTNLIPITMNSNKNVLATFAINTYTLTVNSGPNGNVTKNPDQPTYDHGTVVQLTAAPASGYHFVGWGGDASGKANPLSLTMNSDKTVTATFSDSSTLTVNTSFGGSVLKDPDQPKYADGTVVRLMAVASAGYAFVGWGGDAGGSANPLDVTMNTDKVISAGFIRSGGIDLSASACPGNNGARGGDLGSIDCSGGIIPIVLGTWSPAEAIPDAIGLQGTIVLRVSPDLDVANFWDFTQNGCGNPAFDFSAAKPTTGCASPNSYTNVWGATPQLSVSVQRMNSSLERIDFTILRSTPTSLMANQKCFGFAVSIDATYSVESGLGTCNGCPDPACLEWASARPVAQSSHTSVLSTSTGSGFPNSLSFNSGQSQCSFPEVDVPREPQPQIGIRLSSIWPNPGTSSFNLVFSLASREVVRMVVFDAAGRLVRTLLPRQSLSAGLHSIVWDGRDASGKPVPSAMYLIRLSGISQVVTRTLAVVR